MKKTRPLLVLAFTAALVAACGSPKTPATAGKPKPVSASAAAIGVIPAPRDITEGKGVMRIDGGVDVLFTGGEPARQTAQYFVDLMNRLRDTGLATPKEGAARAGAVNFVLDAAKSDLGAEGYSLVSAPDRVTITAATPAGLFYGGITLWQMATAKPQQGIGVSVPAATVTDAPRFAWRGLMLDSVRHFQSVEYVKQFIDWMALHKMNTLHWHLTDDQGWRLQIKKYPKLTSVGAWRVPAGPAARADIDPKTGKPRVIGGFYTQDQAREIVAYAAARHITVVPEIEMPGHATAAVVAYPELGVSGANLPKAV